MGKGQEPESERDGYRKQLCELINEMDSFHKELAALQARLTESQGVQEEIGKTVAGIHQALANGPVGGSAELTRLVKAFETAIDRMSLASEKAIERLVANGADEVARAKIEALATEQQRFSESVSQSTTNASIVRQNMDRVKQIADEGRNNKEETASLSHKVDEIAGSLVRQLRRTRIFAMSSFLFLGLLFAILAYASDQQLADAYYQATGQPELVTEAAVTDQLAGYQQSFQEMTDQLAILEGRQTENQQNQADSAKQLDQKLENLMQLVEGHGQQINKTLGRVPSDQTLTDWLNKSLAFQSKEDAVASAQKLADSLANLSREVARLQQELAKLQPAKNGEPKKENKK